MFNDLSWTDLNAVGTKLEIYRGDAPLDRANLPASPLATLTNGETTYRDENNVLLGKDYYYVFVSSTATDRVVSQNYLITAITRRGPGPQTLKQGDNNLGYFGALQSGEFIDANGLVDLSGIKNFATAASVVNPFPLWHKYVRNNKILIVPEGPIMTAAAWTQLYLAGAVYGTDDNGPLVPTGVTPTKQNARVTIGRDTYRLRLLKGMTDLPYTDVQATVIVPNEWNDLVYPMVHSVPDDQRLDNLNINGKPTFQVIGASGAVSWTHVQELATIAANSTNNARGQGVNADDTVSDYSSYVANRTATGAATTSSYGWLPVLELIEG